MGGGAGAGEGRMVAPQKLLAPRRLGALVAPGTDVCISWYSDAYVRDLMSLITDNPVNFATWKALTDGIGSLKAEFKNESKPDEDLFPPELLQEMVKELEQVKSDCVKCMLALGFVPYTLETRKSRAVRRRASGSTSLVDLVVPKINILSHEQYQFGVMRVVSTGQQIMVCKPWCQTDAGSMDHHKGIRTEFVTVGTETNLLLHARFYTLNAHGESIVSTAAAMLRTVMLDQAADRAHTLAIGAMADPILPMLPRVDAAQFGGLTNMGALRMANNRAQHVSVATANAVRVSESMCEKSRGSREAEAMADRMNSSDPFVDGLPGGVRAISTQPAPLAMSQRIAVMPAFMEPATVAAVSVDAKYTDNKMDNARLLTIASRFPLSMLAPDMSHAQTEGTTTQVKELTCKGVADHFTALVEAVWDESNGKAIREAWNAKHEEACACLAREELLRKIAKGRSLSYGIDTKTRPAPRWRARDRYRPKVPAHMHPVHTTNLGHNTKVLKRAARHTQMLGEDEYLRRLRLARGQGMASVMRPDIGHATVPSVTNVLVEEVPAPGVGAEPRAGAGSGAGVERGKSWDGNDSDSDSDSDDDRDIDSDSDSDSEAAEVKKGEGVPESISAEEVMRHLELEPEDIKKLLSQLTTQARSLIYSLFALESTRPCFTMVRVEDLKAQIEMYDQGKLPWAVVRRAVAQLSGVKVCEVPEKDPVQQMKEDDLKMRRKEMEMDLDRMRAEMDLDMAKMKAGLIQNCNLQPGGGAKAKASASKGKPASKPAAFPSEHAKRPLQGQKPPGGSGSETQAKKQKA